MLLGYVLDFYVKYKRKPETGDYMNITVYLGANPGKDEKYKKGVWELGTWIAAAGHRLIYGGSALRRKRRRANGCSRGRRACGRR